MQSRIGQLMGIDYKFDLMLSEDGSGRGAALVAAVLKRDEINRKLVENGEDEVFQNNFSWNKKKSDWEFLDFHVVLTNRDEISTLQNATRTRATPLARIVIM